MLEKKIHHRQRQGGKTENQDDSEGPHGEDVGFLLDILALRALRMLGQLSEEPAADI